MAVDRGHEDSGAVPHSVMAVNPLLIWLHAHDWNHAHVTALTIVAIFVLMWQLHRQRLPAGIGGHEFSICTRIHQPIDFLYGAIKAMIFGLIICTISCYFGFNCGKGPEGVGQATNRAWLPPCPLHYLELLPQRTPAEVQIELNVYKSFGENTILRDISLKIPTGQTPLSSALQGRKKRDTQHIVGLCGQTRDRSFALEPIWPQRLKPRSLVRKRFGMLFKMAPSSTPGVGANIVSRLFIMPPTQVPASRKVEKNGRYESAEHL